MLTIKKKKSSSHKVYDLKLVKILISKTLVLNISVIFYNNIVWLGECSTGHSLLYSGLLYWYIWIIQ